MKALQIGRHPNASIIELPVPEPGPGQVVMRVEAVTTCPQWDLHLRHDEPMFLGHRFQYPYPPGQPGHEATGHISAIGEGVSGFKLEDRVSAWRDAGHGVNGCYAQYALLSAENVIHVPADLPYAATAPVELAMCVAASFLMLRDMNMTRGMRFAVNGLGPAGLIAAQMARAEGAKSVVGFDTSALRCSYARDAIGIDSAQVVDSADAPPARPARPEIDTGIDCVGAKRSVEWLMDRVLNAVALFGVQREEYTFAPRHYHPPLRLCGYPGHSRLAAEYAVGLMRSGEINLAPLVSCELPLDRYNEGIDLLENQKAIKICFRPWL